MNAKETTARGFAFVAAFGVALGLGAGACKGGKTVSPAECMNQCEQTCPFSPDGQGDNDEYLECLEACQTKCS